MEPQHDRRASDRPDTMDRLHRVEDAVVNIKDTLTGHIESESEILRDMSNALVRLTVLSEKQDERADRQEERADKQDERFDALLTGLESRMYRAEGKLNIIWTIAPMVVLAVTGLWTVGTYFKWW